VSEAVLFVPFVIGMRRQFGAIGWREILVKPVAAAAIAGVGAVLIWPLGRAAAFGAVVVLYPVLIWALGAVSEDERALLKPLFRRSGV